MAVHNETLGAAIAICGVGGGGGGGSSAVTGVKGASESRYRTGDVNISKVHIGLAEVDNTSDANKPVSTAQQAALDGKQDILTFDALPTEGSENPVTSGGVYSAITGNFDDLLPSMLNADNYVSLMKLWFKQNGAEAMTDFSSLCDRWYTITRTGWTGGTRFYHATTSMASDGTKVGDNADMVAVPSTNDTAGRDDYQDVPLFHCLDCNWILDEDGKPHITAIEGVCGNFERYNPEKLVGVIQMAGWCKYVDDVENDTYTYMYTDDKIAEGYAPLPEAVDLDGTVRSWVVHGKYLSGDDYGCYSGARPWAYNASHNTARTNYHTKWGNQYGGKTSADDAFLKLMFFLKYGSLTADGMLQGCVNYNYQYPVAVEETGVERVILTASQANNIKVGSTVMVGNPTAFSSGTTLNIDRNQAGMRAKVDRKKVTRKETLSSGNVAVYIDNGGVAFDTTSNTLQANKTVGPVGIAAIGDAVGGTASGFTINIEPVQSGSGDPSPDNVRPISGWTGAKVTRCGKNFLKPVTITDADVTYNGVTLSVDHETGVISINGTANAAGGRTTLAMAPIHLVSGTYYISTFDTHGTQPQIVVQTFADGVYTPILISSNSSFILSQDSDIVVGINVVADTVYSSSFRLQLELGSTATDYESYQTPAEYNIAFPSEAGTVYGGTLDVVNGTLTVDKKSIIATTTIRSYSNPQGIRVGIIATDADEDLPQNKSETLLCSMLPTVIGGTQGQWGNNISCIASNITDIGITIKDITTGEGLNEWLSQYKPQIVYKINPIVYQLTPNEIALLSGSNTVSSDCGNVTLQYTANIPSQTYVSTSQWFTGTCDNVRGRDGSPADPSNGTEPYILQGIECALGGYEVFSDTIIKYYKDLGDKYHLRYYICRDASKYSTGITADYGLVDYEVDCPASNSWQYISEHGRDDDFPEACFPHLIGCTSSQRTKDSMYILAASESAYEYLSLGNLNNGVGNGGLSLVNANNGLGTGSWSILARLSPNGNRGSYDGGE